MPALWGREDDGERSGAQLLSTRANRSFGLPPQPMVKYWTRAIDGLSENDFICAAKINELLG